MISGRSTPPAPGRTASLLHAWIRLLSGLVPTGARREWAAEWHAEIDWDTGPRLVLAARCLGAGTHAVWMRSQRWSLDMLLHDLRHAARLLARRPAFTALAVCTLALGIGSNTAMFGVVYGVLLRPLPYREPARLVQLWETNPLRNWTQATIAPANFLDWQARNRVFEDMAWYMGSDTNEAGVSNYTLTDGATAERVRGLVVSPNFFRVLGVAPALGRDFRDNEAVPGQQRVLVLSHGFWQRRFGSDRSLVGRNIQMGPRHYLVAGIMPPAFRFGAAPVDFWAPLAYRPEQYRTLRQPHFLRGLARLKPGVPVERAQAEMNGIAAALEREYPQTNTKMGVGLGPLTDWFVGRVRLALLVFLGAVGCLLLIACANVANLMLSQAVGRVREMAIRSALGAERLRLVKQMLTESLLLSLAGGALGVGVAFAGVRLFVSIAPPDLPRLDDVRVDGWVLAFTAGLTVCTALLFGLVPALHAARANSAHALAHGARGGSSRGRSARRALVIAEVALAFVLAVGAGLLMRSFIRLQDVYPGFDPAGILTASVSLPAQYDDDTKARRFFEQAVDRLRAVPGIVAAGASTRIALDGYMWTGDLGIEGRPEVWGRELRHKWIVPGYFEAMGLRLLAGRSFLPTDDEKAPVVVVVNETLAKEYFPAGSPVGRRVTFTKPGQPPQWVSVIGVVSDEKQDGLDVPVNAEVYETHLQKADTDMTFVARCAGSPSGFVPQLRQAIASVDPTVAVFNVKTMNERMADAVARQRLAVWLFTFFGVAALVLAGVGVAAVVAFLARSRSREIGVRVALGASAANVLGMILRDGLRSVGAGLAIGAALAALLSRTIGTLLFQTSASDPAVFAGVGAFILVVSLAAAFLPARLALRVDPAQVLRAE
jgi:putative ABC transport system permease protein